VSQTAGAAPKGNLEAKLKTYKLKKNLFQNLFLILIFTTRLPEVFIKLF
jgi:hypothetical protein